MTNECSYTLVDSKKCVERRTCLRILFYIVATLLIIIVACFFFVFIICPLIFKYSVGLQRGIVFLNFINWPRNINLEKPEDSTLEGARNLYINFYSKVSEKEITLGVWHVLPYKYSNWSSYVDVTENVEEAKIRIFDELLENSRDPIILYAHGNANNRAAEHRVEIYQIFQDLNYHVIAFDYRGYGDSTLTEVSEIGVTEDTISVYNWLLNKTQNFNKDREHPTPIFIWGHSLGTGISLHALSLLTIEHSFSITDFENRTGINLRLPNGIFLESPFTSLKDELYEHFLGKIFTWLPWFEWAVTDAVSKNNISVHSEEYMKSVTAPVMIFHAKDDMVVPYKLGEKLYQSALENIPETINSNGVDGDKREIEFKSFESAEKLGHTYICRAEILPIVIRDFVRKHSLKSTTSFKLKANTLKSNTIDNVKTIFSGN